MNTIDGMRLCFQLLSKFPSWTSPVRSPSHALVFQDLGAARLPAVSNSFQNGNPSSWKELIWFSHLFPICVHWRVRERFPLRTRVGDSALYVYDVFDASSLCFHSTALSGLFQSR